MTRRTKAKDLRRRAGTRRVRRTVVFFCEGVASEPDYIDGLKRLPEVLVRVLPHRDTARRRARSLTARHHANGTAFPKDNPSSTMYAFLDAIEPLDRTPTQLSAVARGAPRPTAG